MKRIDEYPVCSSSRGRPTRTAQTVSKGLLFVFLGLMGFTTGLPTHLVDASGLDLTGAAGKNPGQESVARRAQTVGADSIPDLSLPRTVLSSVNDFGGPGRVIQASPDNLTLFNSGLALRLLGGLMPRDQLLGLDHRVLSSWSGWSMEAAKGGAWIPLVSKSNNLTVAGTNSTGTYVVRTMQVGSPFFSGFLTVVYKAMPDGSLKWILEFSPADQGRYRLVYELRNITSTHELSASSKKLRVSFAASNYTLSWGDVPTSFNTTSTILGDRFVLGIDLGALPAGAGVQVDPTFVASSNGPSATAYSYQRRVFYEPLGGYYWIFYYDSYGLAYTNSIDGKTWGQGPLGGLGYVPAPFGWGADVFASGRTVIVAQGGRNDASGSQIASLSTSISWIQGSINGANIAWSQTYQASTETFNCPVRNCQSVSIGIRDVATSLSQQRPVFSYNLWYYYQPPASAIGSCMDLSIPTYSYSGMKVAYYNNTGSWHSVEIFSNSTAPEPNGQLGECYRFDLYRSSIRLPRRIPDHIPASIPQLLRPQHIPSHGDYRQARSVPQLHQTD